MQHISSQTTDGICIFTFRKTHPILIEIKLPQSLRTSLAEHVIMKMVCSCKLVPSSFLFSKNILLDSQAYCISRSGKWWNHLYPLIAFSCTCRPAETFLAFLCICMFCPKKLSQDYQELRISPSTANLLPAVTLRFFWHYIFQGFCLLWNFPTSLPPPFAFLQFECDFRVFCPQF